MKITPRGDPSALRMSLQGFLLLALASTCLAQEVQEPRACEITSVNGNQVDVHCENITSISEVQKAIINDEVKVGSLRILRSPLLVLTREEFDNSLFTELRSLGLESCGIVTFNPEPLQGLTNLNYLSLQDNNITSLNADTFSGLESLNTLYLKENDIAHIDPNALTVFTNLTALDLSSNNLASVNGIFVGSNLLRLSLEDNLFTSIGAESLKDLVTLDSLVLNNNNINHIDSRAFQSLTNLRGVQLKGNKLESLDARLFENNPLIILDLGENNLENIANFPLNISTLLGLGLEGCNITTIPVGYFNNLPKLHVLHLGNNKLTDIDENTFTSLTALAILKINNNRLKSLSVASFDQLYKVMNRPGLTEGPFAGLSEPGIELGGNPWDCTKQDMVELRAWTQEHGLVFDELFDCNHVEGAE